jgi:hypothetical protein
MTSRGRGSTQDMAAIQLELLEILLATQATGNRGNMLPTKSSLCCRKSFAKVG